MRRSRRWTMDNTILRSVFLREWNRERNGVHSGQNACARMHALRTKAKTKRRKEREERLTRNSYAIRSISDFSRRTNQMKGETDREREPKQRVLIDRSIAVRTSRQTRRTDANAVRAFACQKQRTTDTSSSSAIGCGIFSHERHHEEWQDRSSSHHEDSFTSDREFMNLPREWSVRSIRLDNVRCLFRDQSRTTSRRGRNTPYA